MQKRLLLIAFLLSIGLFAKDTAKGDATSKTECDHSSHSTELPKEAFAGLNSMQQRVLANLAGQHRRNYPMAVCFAPGTPQATIDQHYKKATTSAFRVDSFRIDETDGRWLSTATDGNGIPRGVPITLRWSILNDGVAIPVSEVEPDAPSNLKAFLNGIYGNQATWQALFQQAFDRWGELSGVTYVFEPNDDGALFPDTPGVVGVRGDVRIGGRFIDGNSNVLAYNYYPTFHASPTVILSVGDMVIDTGDNFYANNTANNSLGFRNVLAHEAGHGLGFNHVCPVEQKKLMEPFVSFAFSGPQHDDILAVQRNYGDNYGVINTSALAWNLNSLTNGSITITNASIDGAGEVDFFKFSLPGTSKLVSLTLSPVGHTYLEGFQNENGTCTNSASFNSKIISDLSLQFLDSNGSSVLASVNANGVGLNESLTNFAVSGTGPYYIRVAGSGVDNVQLYQLTVTIGDGALAAPVLVAEPSTTPGTSNTVSWGAVQALSAGPQNDNDLVFENSSLSRSVAGTMLPGSGAITDFEPVQLTRPSQVPAPLTEKSKAGFEIAPIWQGIFSDGFEGAFPGPWLLSGTHAWDDVNINARSGSWSAWSGGSANPATGYPDSMQSWMEYGPFSLADATSARLSFWVRINSEPNADYLNWAISTDGGLNYSGFKASGNQNGSVSMDLSNFGLGNVAGQSQVWLAFIFESNTANSGAQGYTGAFLDDVLIEKDVITLPDITPSQPANWNDEIPVGITQLGLNDSHVYSGNYYANQTLYFNWASLNQGGAAASNYTVRVEVTGTGGNVWTYNVGAHAASAVEGLTLDQAVGPLAVGSHTFKVWVDHGGVVSESNEGNNYYERTINVLAPVATEYYAESASNSSFTSPVGSGWISGTQYTFQNLTIGQTYWYRVKARQGAIEGPWSTSVNSQQVGAPILSVGPASHNFGTTQVGTPVDRTFAVTNSGTGTLSGNASVSSPFSVFSGGTYNLTAGQSQSVVIRYSPVAAGTNTVNVTFTGGAGLTREVSGIATNANTPPTVTITLPTSNSTFSTNQNTISLGGTASDNLAVISVSWSNSRGGSGLATGTTSWTVPAITLQPGTNVLTVTAQDAALATGNDTLSIVFIPPNVFRSIVKTNGNIRFTLDGEVGRTYVVQYSSNLVTWPNLVTLTNTTGTMIHTDPGVTNGARFYRSFPQ